MLYNMKGGNKNLFYFKVGNGWGEYRYTHSISCFQYFCDSGNKGSCRYLQPIALPHILERLQELWHQRQEIMTDHFDCNPFLSTKQIHFPQTLSSADKIEFSVKTPKQRCVLFRVTKPALRPWRSSWCRQWSLANDSAHHAAGTCIWSDESLSRFFSCFA